MEPEVMSKTQRKKMEKRAAWLASLPERDRQRRERRAQRPAKEPRLPLPPILFKSDHAEWLRRRDSAPKLIIDCEFDCELTEKEHSSLKRQLMYCHSAVKRSERPWCLAFCGATERLREDLQKVSCGRWEVPITPRSYLEEFPHENFVYLTADAETELSSLDDSKAYIVGGLVDHNRLKKATHDKAVSQNITTAKLPLSQLFRMTTSKVLTINHVVEILTHYRETGDWAQSLTATLPARKNAVAITDTII